jgi:hypothetical protein
MIPTAQQAPGENSPLEEDEDEWWLDPDECQPLEEEREPEDDERDDEDPPE